MEFRIGVYDIPLSIALKKVVLKTSLWRYLKKGKLNKALDRHNSEINQLKFEDSKMLVDIHEKHLKFVESSLIWNLSTIKKKHLAFSICLFLWSNQCWKNYQIFYLDR